MTTPSSTLPLLEWIDIPSGSITLEKGWDGTTYWPEKAETYKVEPFSISKYPVTYAQFEAFIKDGGYRDNRWWQGLAKRVAKPKRASWPIADHPRENVNWYEAMAFCRWLSDKRDATVTLPTEMQWQRAAQADDNREYPWGKGFDIAKCNAYESGIKQTTPVDRYPSGASPYGVMDLSGNVWEWCLNEYTHPENSDSASAAPRALRGGSWFNDHYAVRVAYRGLFRPANQDNNVGFRLVRSIE